jgi:hypothetical protein
MTPPDQATNIPINTILTWSTVGGANEYIVEYALNSGMSGAISNVTGSTNFGLSGLTAGTTYYWRAMAKNGSLTSDWSSIWSFTTTTPQGLEAPVLWTPVNNSQNVTRSPALYWYPVSGAAYYTLQYSTSTTFNPNTEYANIEVNNQQLSNLAAKTTYYWRVKAHNPPMESAWSTVWKFKTVNSGKFSIPEANEIAVEKASLSFNPNPFSTLAYFKLEVFETDLVSIDITDIFGRKTAVLINEFRNPGTYEFDFDASSIPAGVYYCHLIVGNEIQTLKMVVMK